MKLSSCPPKRGKSRGNLDANPSDVDKFSDLDKYATRTVSDFSPVARKKAGCGRRDTVASGA